MADGYQTTRRRRGVRMLHGSAAWQLPNRPMSAHAGALKRKHSEKTIKELFTTQAKPHAAAPWSPTGKRTRRAPSPATAATSSTPSAMSTADMYSFPSKRAAGPDGADSRATAAGGQRNSLRKTAPPTHAATGPKRLLVKNFRPVRKVDPRVFLDQTWAKTDRALDTIFGQGDIDFSLEELYRGVENVCRQNMAREVKDRLIARCNAHVAGSLKSRVQASVGRANVDVLRATLQVWAEWNSQVVRAPVPWPRCTLLT